MDVPVAKSGELWGERGGKMSIEGRILRRENNHNTEEGYVQISERLFAMRCRVHKKYYLGKNQISQMEQYRNSQQFSHNQLKIGFILRKFRRFR